MRRVQELALLPLIGLAPYDGVPTHERGDNIIMSWGTR
jgi:hypothetical protein